MYNTEHKPYFSEELLRWYEINKRDLHGAGIAILIIYGCRRLCCSRPVWIR